MFFENKAPSILSSIRSAAQYKSHAQLRKFSDSDLRTAHMSDQTARGLARTLKCNVGTIRSHCRRLGLRLKGGNGIVWTAAEDSLVYQCARGLVSVATITRTTKHSSNSVRQRAEQLGVTLVIRDQGQTGPLQAKRGPHMEYENSITVGKTDRLLLKLHEEFGNPRDEIYPGVKLRA
jgi:hypothetical protein